MSSLTASTNIHRVTKVTINDRIEWLPNATRHASKIGKSYASQEVQLETENGARVDFTVFTTDLHVATIPTPRDVERAAERQGARARRETQQSMIHAGLQHTLLIIEVVIEHNGIEGVTSGHPFAPLVAQAREIYEADYIHADHLAEVAADLFRTASSYLDEATRWEDEGPEADLCYAFRAIANLVACDAPGHWLAAAAAAAARADARSQS